jgi:hypothetical protein
MNAKREDRGEANGDESKTPGQQKKRERAALEGRTWEWQQSMGH